MEKFKSVVNDMNKVLFVITIGLIILNIIVPIYITGVCMGVCLGLVICDITLSYINNRDKENKDKLEYKLEKIMHYATGGFLSNINLSYETIEAAIVNHIEECVEEAVKKTKKDYGIE